MVLLFLDLLGVRRLWHEGGREAAEAAFHRFRKTIEEALRGEEGNAVIGGSIETDAAAIVCDTPDVAIRVALRLYRSVFIRAKKRGDERMWLRGAITDCGKECTLRTATAFNSSLTQVEVVTYSPALLDAIAVEKSGIRGMRLIIESGLVTPALISRSRIPVSNVDFFPFRHLNNSTYPGRLQNGYQDVLWMASAEDTEWEQYRRTMASRLRWAAQDLEEFLQAAATQVIFHECTAIFDSLHRRGRDRHGASQKEMNP